MMPILLLPVTLIPTLAERQISSGVYRFLGMTVTSLVAVQSSIQSGPD